MGALCAVASVLLAAALLLDVGPLDRRWWDTCGYDSLMLVVAGLVLSRAVLVSEARLGWLLIGVGLCSAALGNVSFDVAGWPASPSPVDLLWLAAYPLQAGGVVALALRSATGLRRSTALDALVAALGAGTLTAFCFPPLMASASGSPAAVATAMAYPACDVVLLSVVLGGLAALGWPLRSTWGWLGSAFVLQAGADLAYLVLTAQGDDVAGTFLDALWPVSALLVAAGAWRPGRHRALPRAGLSLLAVPGIVTLTSLLVLLGDLAGLSVPAVAEVTAAVALLAVVARTALSFREVSELAHARQLAHTDDLTGLANRRRFHAALTSTARQPGASPAAVLILDLDRFKEVNDSLGHHVGDELLRQLGPRLARVLRPDDLLARLGGDEFGVLLPDTDAPAAALVAGRLLDALREPLDLSELAGLALHVDASIGVAVFPDHASDASGLLQRADVAMYLAKRCRTGVEVSSGRGDGAERRHLETVEQLRAGMDAGQLVLHYQPKLDLRTGCVTGVEALVRWDHPTRGLLYPDAFLALAERSGQMPRLTLTVLGLALEQARVWRSDGLDLSVAVNLCASNLLDEELPAQLLLLLQTFGLPPAVLQLEITETVLMAEPARAYETLQRLRALGLQIALDDYGTGYSSLSYLQDLPVDELKLDRSFVIRSGTDPRSAAIVSSTVGLAHALGLRIVAEGVETAEVLDQLAAVGCDLAQGYHLARPQPAALLTAWLDARRGVVRPAPEQTRT